MRLPGNTRPGSCTPHPPWSPGQRCSGAAVTAATARCELDVVTLDRASVALADGSALHVHLLAHREHAACGNDATSLVLTSRVGGHAEFLDDFTGFHACLGEVTGLRLGHARCFARTERHLQGNVAVVLLGLDLGHAVVGHVHHRGQELRPTRSSVKARRIIPTPCAPSNPRELLRLICFLQKWKSSPAAATSIGDSVLPISSSAPSRQMPGKLR